MMPKGTTAQSIRSLRPYLVYVYSGNCSLWRTSWQDLFRSVTAILTIIGNKKCGLVCWCLIDDQLIRKFKLIAQSLILFGLSKKEWSSVVNGGDAERRVKKFIKNRNDLDGDILIAIARDVDSLGKIRKLIKKKKPDFSLDIERDIRSSVAFEVMEEKKDFGEFRVHGLNSKQWKTVLKTADVDNTIRNLSRNLSKRGKNFDEATVKLIVENERSRAFMLENLSNFNDSILLEKESRKLFKKKKDVERVFTKKEINQELFVEGLLNERITQLKVEARVRRKNEQRRKYRLSAKEVDQFRRLERFYEEPTAADIDASNERKYGEKKYVRKNKSVHPNKRRREARRLVFLQEKKEEGANLNARQRRTLKRAADRNKIVTESGFLMGYDSLDLGDIPHVFEDAISSMLENFAFDKAMFKSDTFKTMMSLFCFIHQVKRDNSFVDYAVIAYNFVSSCPVNLPLDLLISLKDSAALWCERVPLDPSAPMEFEMMEIKSESSLEDHVRSFVDVVNGNFFSSISKILVSAVSMKWFSKDISKFVTHLFGKGSKGSLIDLFSSLITAISTLVNYSIAFLNGTPLTDIFLSKDPVRLFCKNVRHLLSMKEHVYEGLPIEGWYEINDYCEQLKILVENGDVIKKDISPRDERKKDFDKLLAEARIAHMDTRRRIATDRIPPLGVGLVGPPGIGKSKLLKYIAVVWSKVKGREFEDSHIYTRSKTSDYWEGYVPESQPIIHYSELANQHVNIAKNTGDPHMVEINSLIDGVRFPCDMAFGEKGKVFATPDLVLFDTNNEGLHLKYTMHNTAAIRRRFLTISVRVKPEFMKDGTTAIDEVKSKQAGGILLDRYLFDFYTYSANGSLAMKQVIGEGVDIITLTSLLKVKFENHLTHEREMRDADLYSFVDSCLEIKEDVKVDVQHEDNELFVFPSVPSVAQSMRDQGFLEENKYDSSSWQFYGQVFPSEIGSESGFCDDYPFMQFDLRKKLEDFVRFAELTATFFFFFWTFYVRKAFKGIINNTHVGFFYVLLVPFLFLCGLEKFVFLILIPICFITDYVVCRRNVQSLIADVVMQQLETRMDYAKKRLLVFLGAMPLSQLYNRGNNSIVKIGAVVLGGYTLYNLFRSDKKVSEAAQSKLSLPSSANERLNEMEGKFDCQEPRFRVKSKSHLAWTVVENVRPIPVHKNDLADLNNLVRRNTFKVRLENTGAMTHFFGVVGSYAIINKHSLSGSMPVSFRLSTYNDFDNKDYYDVVEINENNSVCFSDDFILFDFGKRQFKDIIKHVCTGEVPDIFDAMIGVENVKARFSGTISVFNSVLGDISIMDSVEYNCNHYGGLCGTPLVGTLTRNANAIVSLHVGGVDGKPQGYGAMLRRDDLIEAVSQLKFKSKLMPIVSQGEYRSDLLLPISKSPFVYETFAHLHYYGRIPGPILINQRSKLQYCNYAEDIVHFLEDELKSPRTDDYLPPLMRPIVRGEEYISPYNIGLRKMNNDPPNLDELVLARVIDVFTSRIISMLEERGAQLKPLTVMDAINGIDGDQFISRINSSTSAAFGFSGKKSEYLPIVSGVTREPVHILKERLVAHIDTYLEGESCGFIFTTQLKDEPRLSSKALAGKTRLFYMSPLDLLILSRMFMSSFYSVMVEHSDIFCVAVGYNMHTQSDSLRNQQFNFAEKQGEGDYGGFDVSNPLPIARAAATIVYRVCEHFGYTDDALVVLQGLLSDGLFPLISLNQDLFCKPGLQPSGKYGTAEDNSLRGVIMLMYAWYSNPSLSDKDFFSYVKPVVYGDDVEMSLKDEIAEYYNSITYAEDCRKYFGMEFTSATKGEVVVPYMDISEVTFLKRRFVRTFSDSYFGQLAIDSIYKSLLWMIPSNCVTEQEQFTGTCVSALWELFFHVSCSEQFDNVRGAFMRCLLANFGGREADFNLPKFQDIHGVIFDAEPIESILVTESGCVWDAPTRFTLYRLFQEGSLAYLVWFLPNRKTMISQEMASNADRSSLIQWYAEEKDYYRARICDLRDEYQDIVTYEDLPWGTRPLEIWARNPSVCRIPGLKQRNRGVIKVQQRVEDARATVQFLDDLLYRKSVIFTESGLVDIEDIDEKQNLLDVAGDEPVEIYSDISESLSIGQREVLPLGEFFARPVEIDNFTASVGSTISVQYPIWDLYTLTPSVRAKLRNYAYLRANLHVRVAISGSPFHFGRLLVSYQPYASRNSNITANLANIVIDANARPSFLNYLSQADSAVVMDIKSNKPVDIVCPFISTKPMHRLFNTTTAVISAATSFDDLSDAGDLFVYSINNVDSVSAGSSSISVQIYAWLTEVELGCSTATQIAITTESGNERIVGPIEKMCSSAATMSNALSDIPIIGPVAKASAPVFTGAAEVAGWYGWSRPNLETEPIFVKNRPFANSSFGVGSETVEKICLDEKQEITVDPRVVARSEDDMSFANIYTRESYLTTVSWAPTDTLMANPIFLCRVSPNLDTIYDRVGYNRFFQPTAMSFVASAFRYWRGIIKFRIEVVASEFHRGKLAIFYEPNVMQASLIDVSLSLNKNFMKIIDIQETQSVEFCVYWAQPRAWQFCLAPGLSYYNYTSFDPTNHGYDSTNGYIGIVPFTEIQSPDDSSVPINIYVSGEELQFNQLSDINLPTARVLSQSGYEDKSDEQVTCFDLNEMYGSSELTSDFHFGEQPLSFRTCLKRYATTYHAAISITASRNIVTVTRPNVLPQNPTYGATSPSYVTLLEYLPYAFLGVKGGVRKRIRFNGSSGFFVQDRTHVSLGAIDSTLTTSIVQSIGPALTYVRGTVQFIPHTNCGIEAEIPFYTNNLFLFSFADDLIGLNTNGDMIQSWSMTYTSTFESDTAVSDIIIAVEDSAIAEDFSFLRFNGSPYFTVVI